MGQSQGVSLDVASKWPFPIGHLALGVEITIEKLKNDGRNSSLLGFGLTGNGSSKKDDFWESRSCPWA